MSHESEREMSSHSLSSEGKVGKGGRRGLV